MNRGPESKDKGLELRYATIAEIGHKGELVVPITRVCPCVKGSVFDAFKRTSIYLGELLVIRVMSDFMRWFFGSKVELQVSSPIRRKPKKASVIAAQSIVGMLHFKEAIK